MKPADPVFVTDSPAIARYLQRWGDFFALLCNPLDDDFDLSLLYEIDVIVVHVAADCTAIEARMRTAGAASVECLPADEWLALTKRFVDLREKSERVA